MSHTFISYFHLYLLCVSLWWTTFPLLWLLLSSLGGWVGMDPWMPFALSPTESLCKLRSACSSRPFLAVSSVFGAPSSFMASSRTITMRCLVVFSRMAGWISTSPMDWLPLLAIGGDWDLMGPSDGSATDSLWNWTDFSLWLLGLVEGVLTVFVECKRGSVWCLKNKRNE